MTKEELEKEAKQSYLNTTEETQWSEEDEFEYTRAYKDGAEPREKRIAELETQIEKMKEKTVSLCEGCVQLPMLYKELEKEIKEK